MKSPIKDTLKVVELVNKGQAEVLLYASPLKKDNLSTKDKMASPEGVLIKRFHCTSQYVFSAKPRH